MYFEKMSSPANKPIFFKLMKVTLSNIQMAVLDVIFT